MSKDLIVGKNCDLTVKKSNSENPNEYEVCIIYYENLNNRSDNLNVYK